MMPQNKQMKEIRVKHLKNCAPFTKCISKINNTDIDNTQDMDIVNPMSNLIECYY